MKNTIIISTAFLFLSVINSSAQHLNKKMQLRKIKLSEIQMGVDMNFNRDISFSLSDFKSLAPESVLLNNDFSSYTSSDKYKNRRMGIKSSFPSIMIGLQFRNRDKDFYKSNPMLRLGISYADDLDYYFWFSKEDSYPYDTLVSTHTGQQYYIDSVSKKNYDMSYLFNQFKFDCSVIYRTNPSAAVSFYSGLGVASGFSKHATTYISQDEYYVLTSSPTYYGFSNNGQYEGYKNKNNSEFSAYIPGGIEFNFFHRRELLNLFHLYYEGRVAINFLSIPETRTIKYYSFISCLGLKMAF